MKNFIVANGRWVLFTLMAYLLGGASSAWSMNGAYRYYIPLFRASSNAGTGIGLSNLNPAVQADIAVSIYGPDGASIGAESKTIPAGGQDAFVVGPGLNADGHMVVGSSQPLAGVCFISEQSGAYMADIPFSETLSRKLTLPHVAQSETWATRLYMSNPNGAESTVTLTFVRPDGSMPYDAYSATLPALGCVAIDLSTIVGDTAESKGRVDISSTSGIAVFGIYHNLKTGRHSYSGIHAVDASSADAFLTVYNDSFKSGGHDLEYNEFCEVVNSDYAPAGLSHEIKEGRMTINAAPPEPYRYVHGIIYRRIWENIARDVIWKIAFDFIIGEGPLITGPEANFTINTSEDGTYTYGVQYVHGENRLQFWDDATWNPFVSGLALEKGKEYVLEMTVDHSRKRYEEISIREKDGNGDAVLQRDLSGLTVANEPKFFVDEVTIALEIDGPEGSSMIYDDLYVIKKIEGTGDIPNSEVTIEPGMNFKTSSILVDQIFSLNISKSLDEKNRTKVIEFYDDQGSLLDKIFGYTTREIGLCPFSNVVVKMWYDGDSKPTASVMVRTVGDDDAICFSSDAR